MTSDGGEMDASEISNEMLLNEELLNSPLGQLDLQRVMQKSPWMKYLLIRNESVYARRGP